MTKFEEDLVTHLLGDAPTLALIADQAANENRIWPDERPEDNRNLPAIVYVVQLGVKEKAVSDPDPADTDLENVELELELWAATRREALALARLVLARMATPAANHSFRAVEKSRRSEMDPETRERCEVLEFSVWHSPQ